MFGMFGNPVNVRFALTHSQFEWRCRAWMIRTAIVFLLHLWRVNRNDVTDFVGTCTPIDVLIRSLSNKEKKIVEITLFALHTKWHEKWLKIGCSTMNSVHAQLPKLCNWWSGPWCHARWMLSHSVPVGWLASPFWQWSTHLCKMNARAASNPWFGSKQQPSFVGIQNVCPVLCRCLRGQTMASD